jgi:regulator of cell morphogenesis and NO signaling
MNTLRTATIKSIVTNDFRAAAIFEKYSLDFCCKGGVSIEQACSEKNLDPALIYADLAQLAPQSHANQPRFSEWPMDELIDYIVNVHHRYVREAIPVVHAHAQKVASVHGDRHPEVVTIAGHFETVVKDLNSHMMKEELVLFPYIKGLVKAKRGTGVFPSAPFGTVQNAIGMMEAEHQAAGEELYEIRSLSNSYAAPDDACTTYRVSFQELQQFEQDLHQHVHLENNILFPKAVELEMELLSSQKVLNQDSTGRLNHHDH